MLKGAHLVTVVCEHTAMLPMSDVDLLVRTVDLPKVVTNFYEMGYIASGPFRLDSCIGEVKHLPRFTKPGAIPVELHWTIDYPGSPFKTDVDGLWKRAKPVTLGGVEALVMSPEDLLLHMCLHISFQHRFNVALKSFYSICEALSRYQEEINWKELQLRSRQWGIGKCVYLTLYLVRDLLAAPVPDAVLNVLKPDDFDLWMADIGKHQVLGEHYNLPLLSHNFVRLWGAKRLQDKALCFLKSVFPSSRALAQMYPAAPNSMLIYTYYPVRLKDLFVRYGRTTWRLLHGEERLVAAAERNYILTNWLTST